MLPQAFSCTKLCCSLPASESLPRAAPPHLAHAELAHELTRLPRKRLVPGGTIAAALSQSAQQRGVSFSNPFSRLPETKPLLALKQQRRQPARHVPCVPRRPTHPAAPGAGKSAHRLTSLGASTEERVRRFSGGMPDLTARQHASEECDRQLGLISRVQSHSRALHPAPLGASRQRTCPLDDQRVPRHHLLHHAPQPSAQLPRSRHL